MFLVFNFEGEIYVFQILIYFGFQTLKINESS